MKELSVTTREVLEVNGGSVTAQGAPRRQSLRLASPIATDSSNVIERSPVLGQNSAGV